MLSVLHLVCRFSHRLIFARLGLNLKNESLLLHVDLRLNFARALAHALEEGIYKVLRMYEFIKEHVWVTLSTLADTRVSYVLLRVSFVVVRSIKVLKFFF